MALELRPNCEYCDRDLPPASGLARICSYECTFCADCVDGELHNVCPNCGGGFVPRPIRPAREWRTGLSVAKRPPSDKRVHLSYSRDDIAAHAIRVKDIPQRIASQAQGRVAGAIHSKSAASLSQNVHLRQEPDLLRFLLFCRYRGQSGKYLFVVRISGFDP